jgi:hypothetical protein
MLLSIFLSENTPLTAVELLPDNRLINVVIGENALYGINVENIPINVQITRHLASLTDAIITADNFTFDTTLYTMLQPQNDEFV